MTLLSDMSKIEQAWALSLFYKDLDQLADLSLNNCFDAYIMPQLCVITETPDSKSHRYRNEKSSYIGNKGDE
jgi:hypothetical protein